MSEILYGNFRIELDANLGNRVDRTVPATSAAFTRLWPSPIDPPPILLGRDQELGQIRQAVMQRQLIQFHASCGFGVTTLLRYVAAARPGVAVPYPCFYLRVGDDPLPDVLHRLVSAAFTSEGNIRPTPAVSAELLAPLQAVVVLDDVRSGPEVVGYLVRIMPGCSLVAGGPGPTLGGSAASRLLPGLPEDAALALLAHDLGHPVAADELPAARRVWAAVAGQPLHLRQAAALVRGAEHTFAELAGAAERDPESLDRLAIAALPNRQRRVLAVLALAAGALLPPDLVSAMASIDDVREAISDLRGRGLAVQHEDRFGLPICKVDTYRPQLLDYVDAGSAARELIGWLTSQDPLSHVSLSVAEAALSLIGFAADQGDLPTVVALVRVVEPILTLAGRWEAYGHALHQGMQAANQLGDQVSQAYFAHQQGTLAMCRDQLPAAQQHLQHALQLRQRLGDRQGAERSQHNLDVLQPTPPPPPPRSPQPRRPGPGRRALVGLVTAGLVLTGIIIGVGIANSRTSQTTPVSGGSPSVAVGGGQTNPGGGGQGSPPGGGGSGGGHTTAEAPNPSPPRGDFGQKDISPGVENPQQTFTITNPNQNDMTLGNAEITDPAFTLVDDKCSGNTLSSLAKCTLTVEFDPGLGSVSATLAIPAADGHSASIPLTGTGIMKVDIALSGPAGPGDQYGTVQDDQGLIECPPTCSAEITDPGQQNLTLSATPKPIGQSSTAIVLDHWEVSCGGGECPPDPFDCSAGTCTVNVASLQEDVTVTAVFGSTPG